MIIQEINTKQLYHLKFNKFIKTEKLTDSGIEWAIYNINNPDDTDYLMQYCVLETLEEMLKAWDFKLITKLD